MSPITHKMEAEREKWKEVSRLPEERYEGMFGKYQHAMDQKGRLFVPAKLREALGDPFYVMIGLENYLTAYPAAKWQAFMAKVSELPISKAPNVRYLLANAAKCEPDKQGRFLLPQILREYANLTMEVTIIGQGDHVEIWNSADYAAKELAFLRSGNLAAELEALGF